MIKNTTYVSTNVSVQIYCNTCKNEVPVVPSAHIKKKTELAVNIAEKSFGKEKRRRPL